MNTDRFKFRVWYEKDKEYLDPDYYEGFFMSPDGVVHAGITEWNGICDNYQEIPQKQLIIEQCTGLKDKNGKLIYEGDVLDDGGIRAVVIFDVDSFLLEYHDGGIGELSPWAKMFEVIGNIHEDQFRDFTKKKQEIEE